MCPKPESTTDFAEQDEVCGEDANLSHPMSSTLSQGDATQCSDEGNTGHELAAEHGVHHPPTSHGYHLGYDATCPNAEDWSYIPSQEGLVAPCSDAQTDDIVCRMPGYDKYASESVMNVNAEYVGQQPYLYSAGCPPQVVFRRPDSVPVNSCNSKQDVGESETVPKSLSNSKQNLLAAKAVGPSSSEGPNFRKASPLDTMHHLYTSSNFPGQVSKSRSEVNASGQFVGLAEMMGPVDFKKTMDFWQQDKWSGFFPVTWHVIKDIPNRQFQNITLENNDNRAVTFSRDTQEIGLPQGLKMLFIFKGYPSGTSILDDFEFYENRAKSLHSKRSSSSSGSVPQHSRAEFDDEYDSMNQLETSFRKMNVPASYDQKPTLFNHNSSSSLNYQVRENRN